MMYEFHMGLMEIVSCAGVVIGQKLGSCCDAGECCPEVKTLLTNHKLCWLCIM